VLQPLFFRTEPGPAPTKWAGSSRCFFHTTDEESSAAGSAAAAAAGLAAAGSAAAPLFDLTLDHEAIKSPLLEVKVNDY